MSRVTVMRLIPQAGYHPLWPCGGIWAIAWRSKRPCDTPVLVPADVAGDEGELLVGQLVSG